jgi:hypothetical protein
MRPNACIPDCYFPLNSEGIIHARVLHVAALAVILVFAGCGAALYVPQPHDARPDISLAQLRMAREAYAQTCGGCHVLVLPERFGPAEWAAHLHRMQKRARLADSTMVRIYRYLVVASAAAKK